MLGEILCTTCLSSESHGNVLRKHADGTCSCSGPHVNGTGAHHVVKVCMAMMLPLICLTGTPSNRTSRARVDGVTGWRVTMSYNELLICNPGCNPGCNTGGPGRFCKRSVGSSS